MDWLKRIFRRDHLYAEVSQSIREHLEEKIEALMENGMSPEEASRVARLEFGNVTQIEEGSLYPALQRMLRAGWLESDMGISARNQPVRIFKLTPLGRKHLQQELSSFEKQIAGINRLLANSKT